jgi:hypothetical protein
MASSGWNGTPILRTTIKLSGAIDPGQGENRNQSLAKMTCQVEDSATGSMSAM